MKTLRTPDERFESLEGYPFEPHYVEVDDPDGRSFRSRIVEAWQHVAVGRER